jgi:hypothetical protein
MEDRNNGRKEEGGMEDGMEEGTRETGNKGDGKQRRREAWKRKQRTGDKGE